MNAKNSGTAEINVSPCEIKSEICEELNSFLRIKDEIINDVQCEGFVVDYTKPSHTDQIKIERSIKIEDVKGFEEHFGILTGEEEKYKAPSGNSEQTELEMKIDCTELTSDSNCCFKEIPSGVRNQFPEANLKKFLLNDWQMSDKEAKVEKCVERKTLNSTLACQLCPFKSETMKGLRAHLKDHLKAFQCSICSYGCNRKCDMIYHMMLHDKINYLECEACGYRCVHRRKMSEHMKEHFVSREFSGPVCQKSSETKRALEFHLHVREHSSERTFESAKCLTETSSDLKYHSYTKYTEKSNSDQEFTCSACFMKCLTRASFTNHIKKHHGGLPYQCADCTLRSPYKSVIKRHIFTQHILNRESDPSKGKSGDTPFFANYHWCSACSKKYLSKYTLEKHIAVVHPGFGPLKPFPLRKPLKTTPYQGRKLRKDPYLHTSLSVLPASAPRGVADLKGPLHCGLCSFSCFHKSDLFQHSRMHCSIDKNCNKYQCLVCHVVYKTEATLIHHVRCHQFACHLCSFKCCQLSNLASHIKSSHLLDNQKQA